MPLFAEIFSAAIRQFFAALAWAFARWPFIRISSFMDRRRPQSVPTRCRQDIVPRHCHYRTGINSASEYQLPIRFSIYRPHAADSFERRPADDVVKLRFQAPRECTARASFFTFPADSPNCEMPGTGASPSAVQRPPKYLRRSEYYAYTRMRRTCKRRHTAFAYIRLFILRLSA